MDNISEGNVAVGETGVEDDARSRIRARRRFNWNWVLIPTVFVLGIIVGCLARPIVWESPATPSNTNQIVQLLISKTRHLRGSSNAPVTILEFSDFQ